MIIETTWTLRQVYAMADALRIREANKLHIASQFVGQLFGGKK